MRLRQVVLAARDLRAAEAEICGRLGVEVCYRDPGLAEFGLRHGLYPIGDRLLEVIVPKQSGTTAGRFLDRNGEGGYMVIAQTDDLDREQARLTAAGIRVIFEATHSGRGESVRGLHLHPKDVGAAILSIDQADPPESWPWAGHDWRYHRRDDVVTDITGLGISCEDPAAMAASWSAALGIEAAGATIQLDDAVIRFGPATPGQRGALTEIDVVAADRTRVGERVCICGADFVFV